MKILCVFGLLFLASSCASSTNSKAPPPELSKSRWQNVDGELKSGAKKARGLLEKAGIVGSEDTETENPTTKVEEPKEGSGFLHNMQSGANRGWNKILGFFDGLFENENAPKVD
jgi:hypothetical protein